MDVRDFVDYAASEVRGRDGQMHPQSGPVRNVVVLRVDATLSDGWFYEGAGVYRHVWLRKTGGLHLVKDGVFVQGTPGAGGGAGVGFSGGGEKFGVVAGGGVFGGGGGGETGCEGGG